MNRRQERDEKYYSQFRTLSDVRSAAIGASILGLITITVVVGGLYLLFGQ